MVAAGLAMLMVVGLVQVIAYQYVRGAVQVALERGVRAGSVVGAGEAECRAAIADSLAAALGGAVRDSLTVECRAEPEAIAATASGAVPAWMGPAPELGFTLGARAVREPPP